MSRGSWPNPQERNITRAGDRVHDAKPLIHAGGCDGVGEGDGETEGQDYWHGLVRIEVFGQEESLGFRAASGMPGSQIWGGTCVECLDIVRAVIKARVDCRLGPYDRRCIGCSAHRHSRLAESLRLP